MSQELKKIKSKKSGDGADDVYVSSWQYFEALKFLIPVLTVNETKSSLPGTVRKSTCGVVNKTNFIINIFIILYAYIAMELRLTVS